MTSKLLKRYFDDNWFLNEVMAAAFRERAQWEFREITHVVALVSVSLKAPPCRSVSDHVALWVQSGWAVLEKRDGRFFILPGKRHDGADVRDLGPASIIPSAITDAIKPAAEKTQRYFDTLKTLEIE